MASRGRKTLAAIWAIHRCEDPRLTPEHKVLWTLYRSYQGRGDRGAFPGDELLATHMGRSVRSVQGYRADLTEWGYLEQQLRGPRPALYWAVLPPGLVDTLPEDLRPGAGDVEKPTTAPAQPRPKPRPPHRPRDHSRHIPDMSETLARTRNDRDIRDDPEYQRFKRERGDTDAAA